jgi:hypothetical protein
MMKLDRRRFLQGLLMLGISPSELLRLPLFPSISGYQLALAEKNSRKLALLVGINRYSPLNTHNIDSNSPYLDLQGCLTDVELQRELLIERYGFQATDILMLTDAQATRENIENAFVEHLVNQAQAGDVVVFHFSGYGSRIKIPSLSGSTALSPSSEEIFGFLPSDGLTSEQIRNDLMQESLYLLARSLRTDKVTMVLDCSHSESASSFQGNLRTRSCLIPADSPSPQEIDFQSQIATLAKTLGKKTKADPPGIALMATSSPKVAVEFLGDGFSAGLFTYSLTQHLWQVTPARRGITVFNQVEEAIAPSMGKYQQPQAFLAKNTALPLYGISSPFSQGSEAVIEKILEPASSKLVVIKFTGISPLVLDNGVVNSCFQVISEANADSGEDILLQVTEQTGRKAKASLLNAKVSLSGKEPLQEIIRAIPRHLGLTVALDSQFDRIERVDATSAFSAIAVVTGVINAGEQSADCVLGQKTGGYGLFSEGGRLLFSTGTGNIEAIKSIIGKLTPKLEQVLAKKWWDLTANENSSRLGLRATLAVLQDSQAIAVLTKEADRYDFSINSAPSLQSKPIKSPETLGLVSIASGSRLQYRLENHQDQLLYFVILGIDANGKAIAWYPGDQPESIPPQQSQTIPAPSSAVSWRVPSNGGLAQIQVIASLKPFQQFWEALAENLPNLTSPDATSHPAQILEVQNPLAIAQSLLEDLHRNSAVSSTMINNTTDYYALNMTTWATLNFIYQVI